MKIRKFCACGMKLERDVTDEETARKVVTMFWTEHAGTGHQPVPECEYRKVIRRIIKAKARANLNVVLEIEELEKTEMKRALDWLEEQNTAEAGEGF